jgi:thioredoxin-dependent peroxiredoxin
MTSLRPGQPAPDFTLPLASFGTISLSNMRGRPVVIYFYPKDDTPGCTTEACGFQQALPDFGNLDVAVIGISKDTVESHAAFAKKYNLQFHLASDANSDTAESYGVWVQKNMHGHKYMGIERTTFLIDRQGIIRAIWPRVKVEGHVEDVLKYVEALQMGQPLPGEEPPPPPPPASVKAAPVKAAPVKATPVKGAPAAKPAAKKAAAKKPAPAAKKSAAKKAAVKKAPAKKAPAKKAPIKKAAAKKPVAKKVAPKKPAKKVMKKKI